MPVRAHLVAVVTLAAAGLLPAVAAAQPAAGLKAGAAISQLATDPKPPAALQALNDLSAGGFVIVGRGPVAAQIDGLVSRRGVSIGGNVAQLVPGTRPGDRIKLRVTYLDLSALVRVRVGPESVRLYAIGGPTVGIALQSQLVLPGSTRDLDAETEDVDVALTAGAGLSFEHLILEARYSHGLTDIADPADIFGVSLRHRSVSILFGVRF